jgi:cation diffusion facilitator CzcD-associated flavoprotein CzcO
MQIIALAVLAFTSVQAGFIAHEAGHGAITKRSWLAKSIGQFFNTFLTGLCYSHFQYIHTRHHSHVNEQAEDLDMQSDFFSLYPKSASDKDTRFGQFITRYQAYLIWPLVSLQGFTLKIDSFNTLRKNPKATRIDQIALALHLLIWFGLPVYILGLIPALLNYVVMTWFIGPYLGIIFLVNHIGTRVIGPNENMPTFFQRLVTTRNVGNSKIEDLVFGGVNNHIEHHLFPTIGSFRLRHARVITREFCKEHRLPYREMSWLQAAGEVFTYLNQITQRLEGSEDRRIMRQDETLVTIIGAGITGIAASYYLSKNNIKHLIIEKRDEVGGIWSSQNWPGIRCDSDIIKYSYTFKPFLSKQCLASGETISNYLHATSKELEIHDKILFGVKVEKAAFDTKEKIWRVHTNKGCFKSKFLINANGYFSDKPHSPNFPGTEKFKGEITHIVHLDKKADIKNKRIVLVGSGASAICAAPELCSNSLSMTLLQRSPSYIYEENNKIGVFVNMAQKLYEVGWAYPMKVVSYFIQLKDDLIFVVFRNFPSIGKLFFKYHWKNSIDQKTFKENFQPTYNPYEQRIPVSLGLKELIRNKKINIVTGQIKSFTGSGIKLMDGRYIESDFCVLATGFNLSYFKFDLLLNDKRVDTDGINCYKGMMMGGIPNYFQPMGVSHTSWTRRIEVVSKLITKIISHMQKHNIDTVTIDRKKVRQNPTITPNYVKRNMSTLPASYGSLELPSIDNFLFYFFRKSNFKFSGSTLPKEST